MANHDHCNHDHDNNCCGNHQHQEEEFPLIHLELEDGENLDCIVYGTFDFNNKSYIALIPDEGEEESLLLYEYEDLGDDEIDLKLIEEEELDAVADEFERQFPVEDEE